MKWVETLYQKRLARLRLKSVTKELHVAKREKENQAKLKEDARSVKSLLKKQAKVGAIRVAIAYSKYKVPPAPDIPYMSKDLEHLLEPRWARLYKWLQEHNYPVWLDRTVAPTPEYTHITIYVDLHKLGGKKS